MEAWEKVIAKERQYTDDMHNGGIPQPRHEGDWICEATACLGELADSVRWGRSFETEEKLINLAAVIMLWLENYDD